MKSPAMLPPRKDPITNQNITIIITQQDPILPTSFSKVPTVHKKIIDDINFSNHTESEHNDSTYNSRTYNEDAVGKTM